LVVVYPGRHSTERTRAIHLEKTAHSGTLTTRLVTPDSSCGKTMNRSIPVAACAALIATLAQSSVAAVTDNAAAQLPADNPFAHESTLPYALPPFDKIHDEHFRPALIAGMAAHRVEIDAIAKNSAPPTFENTIVAMEKAGQLLDRVTSVYGNLTSSNT